ncbi:MAG: DsbA family protein, partial [Acidobacteriota bacterium]|nr:DsbA family protein [Acidobacteriota bacterium]
HAAGAPLEWRPVLSRDLALAEETGSRAEIERRAALLGLQPMRWPEDHPTDSEIAMLAATYAKSIGRAVPFAQAAFRQAFAGGHSLADTRYVLLAAAACEIHPTAVLRAIERRGVAEALAQSGRQARLAGIERLPAITAGGHLFAGERAVEDAARLLRGHAPHAGGGGRGGQASERTFTAAAESVA